MDKSKIMMFHSCSVYVSKTKVSIFDYLMDNKSLELFSLTYFQSLERFCFGLETVNSQPCILCCC